MAGDVLADARRGKNGRHALAGSFRQSVVGRLSGYEDVNDAERLRHDPAMRWIVGGNAVRLQLHALAYNRGNFLRTLATPEPIKDWSLTSLEDKLTPSYGKCSRRFSG
jgi:hypothetical protein